MTVAFDKQVANLASRHGRIRDHSTFSSRISLQLAVHPTNLATARRSRWVNKPFNIEKAQGKVPQAIVGAMKLKIEIDGNLMRQAMRSGKYRTRKAAIESGLRLLLLRGQTKIRQLRGKIAWDGDLEESRLGKNTDR